MKNGQVIRTRRLQQGFTLLEIMFAAAIMAILLGIGVPSFRNSINLNRVAGASNQLTTALSVTRSEATKRGIAVTICGTNAAQTACAASTNWNNGWMVFTDNAATAGTYEPAGTPNEVILYKSPAVAANLTLTAKATASPVWNGYYLRVLPNGRPANQIDAAFDLKNTTGTTYLRCLTVAKSGRVSLAKTVCP